MPGTTVVEVKILHTSDWHLGRTLHGVDLHDHQRAFVDHLVELVGEHEVAAVLVSGDVYDRAIPAVETVRVLEDALARLSALTAVIITPGNHDSAVRLGFGATLMRDSVRILAAVADLHQPVLLDDGSVQVAVYGLPYLDPETARAALTTDPDEPPARSHEGVIGAAMRRIHADLATRSGVRSVVMAHAFVVGGEPSDSERDLSVGGVQSVPSAVFAGVDYVALGHLHGPQQVTVPGATTLARYSGSPLAYSFSERSHHKSTVLLDIGADGPPTVSLLDAPIPRRLTEIRGDLAHVLSSATDAHVDDWVKIVVTDAAYPADMHARVRARFGHLLHLTHEPVGGSVTRRAPVVDDSRTPPEVTADFLEFVTAQAPTDDELTVVDRAYDVVRAMEHSA